MNIIMYYFLLYTSLVNLDYLQFVQLENSTGNDVITSHLLLACTLWYKSERCISDAISCPILFLQVVLSEYEFSIP